MQSPTEIVKPDLSAVRETLLGYGTGLMTVEQQADAICCAFTLCDLIESMHGTIVELVRINEEIIATIGGGKA